MKKKIKTIEKEIKELDKERKFYKIQSEWFAMMYKKYLLLETLKSINNGDN